MVCVSGVRPTTPQSQIQVCFNLIFPVIFINSEMKIFIDGKYYDERTAKIYETIGVYLGYTIPHYAEFYDYRQLLVLGRVTTGEGGNVILKKAREVLLAEFPALAGKITLHLPDDHVDESHGQGQQRAAGCHERCGHHERHNRRKQNLILRTGQDSGPGRRCRILRHDCR